MASGCTDLWDMCKLMVHNCNHRAGWLRPLPGSCGLSLLLRWWSSMGAALGCRGRHLNQALSPYYFPGELLNWIYFTFSKWFNKDLDIITFFPFLYIRVKMPVSPNGQTVTKATGARRRAILWTQTCFGPQPHGRLCCFLGGGNAHLDEQAFKRQVIVLSSSIWGMILL